MSNNLKKMYEKLRSNLTSQEGQGLVEYALILVLIAIVVIAAVHSVGSSTQSTFCNINTHLTTGQ